MQPKPLPPRINTDFAHISNNGIVLDGGANAEQSPLEKAVDYINQVAGSSLSASSSLGRTGSLGKGQHRSSGSSSVNGNGNGTASGTGPIALSITTESPAPAPELFPTPTPGPGAYNISVFHPTSTQNDPSSNSLPNPGHNRNPLVVEVERATSSFGNGWNSVGQKTWVGYTSGQNSELIAEGGGFGSPPSPSTIDTSTDEYGGDNAPPSSGTYSSIGGDDPSNQSDYYRHGGGSTVHPLLRARSVSQPSSYSSRKQTFHLNIPQNEASRGFGYGQPETISPAMLNEPGGTDVQYVYDSAGQMMALSPSALAENDYFVAEQGGMSARTVPFGMDVDMANAAPTAVSNFSGTSMPQGVETYPSLNAPMPMPKTNDYRYGYRLPASQPSSPVRSGYPPGMAPFAAMPSTTGGTRPRGATVSGMMGQVGYHDYTRLQSVNTPLQAVGMPQPVQAMPMHPQQISHQHHNSSPFHYSVADSPSTHSMSSYASAAGPVGVDPASPFHPTHHPGSSVPSAPSTPAPPIMQPNDNYMGGGTPSRLAFSSMSMASGNGGMDQMLVNPVPLLETQAQAAAGYNLGMGDMAMESSTMAMTDAQANYMQAMADMNAAPTADDYMADSIHRSRSGIDSRRSSASASGFMPGHTMNSSFSSLMPMTEMATLHPGINGTMTPDLSAVMQEKLRLIDIIAQQVAQAKADVLRGDGNAADDQISNVGNAILEQALAPTTQTAMGTIQPAMHLNLPALDDLVAQAAPMAGLLDANSLPVPKGQSAATNSTAGLAPPIQLKRSNSQKRSAPESPLMTEAANATNKHMRLDDVAMDTAEQPLPATNKVFPPPMIHSHSFPNGHLLPSQTVTTSPGVSVLTSPLSASPSFTSQLLAPTFSIPHVPSPLSALPMTAQHASPGPYAFGSVSPNPVIAQSASLLWQSQPVLSSTPISYPGTPLQTVPETGVFVPVQQPGLTTRRGSIVDGRLIAGLPVALSSMAAADIRVEGTSTAPPTNATTTSGPVKRSSTPDPDGMDDDGDSDSGGEEGGERSGRRQSGEGGAAAPPGSLVQPPDLVSDGVRAQLDIILHSFLNVVCSNLEFHDAKGELLHQALMPKKMAKLDESKDFRPFKFRIQAFTNAFQEELQRIGVLEEALSAKKIKSYLWTQTLISRYNDDGKKAKSKGNHIWMVNAKRLPSGSWVFKQFQRKMLPLPSAQAFVGSLYSWAPRVWDPQSSTAGLKVEYTSPEGSLPDWLSWKGPLLSGTPRSGGVMVPISVVATFKDSNAKQHQLYLDYEIRVSDIPGGSVVPPPMALPNLLNSESLMMLAVPEGLQPRSGVGSPFLDTGMHQSYQSSLMSQAELSTTPTQAYHPAMLDLHASFLGVSPIPLLGSVPPQPLLLDGMAQGYGTRMPMAQGAGTGSGQAEYEQLQNSGFLDIPR